MMLMGLTRASSATAGGSERAKIDNVFHKFSVGGAPASGWLQRLVRRMT
jgi:hypothetical protein